MGDYGLSQPPLVSLWSEADQDEVDLLSHVQFGNLAQVVPRAVRLLKVVGQTDDPPAVRHLQLQSVLSMLTRQNHRILNRPDRLI